MQLKSQSALLLLPARLQHTLSAARRHEIYLKHTAPKLSNQTSPKASTQSLHINLNLSKA